MFNSVPMTPEERRRIAVGMARLRVAGQTTRRTSTRRLPQALPCTDYEKAFADVAMPTGTVVMSDAAELQSWLLVARPVSRKEAEKKGGCIRFTPLSSTTTTPADRKSKNKSESSKSSSVKPLYFCITDTDDEVYGRAAYLPRKDSALVVKKSVSTLSLETSSCHNECTEEDEEESTMSVSVRSNSSNHRGGGRRVTPHRHNSCRCVVKA